MSTSILADFHVMYGTIICNLITAFDMVLITAFPFTRNTISYSTELLCLTGDVHTITQGIFEKNNGTLYTWCFQVWSVGLKLRNDRKNALF